MKVITWAIALYLLLLLSAAWPSSASAQTVVKYIHTDALGSIVAVTDASGNVIERREYEPYGAQLTPALQDGPGYTGHVQDAATGLTYMQQRYYDPEIGRMLSRDPVTAYSSGNMRHFNPYAYAFNNPYKFTDPDGRSPDTFIDAGFIIYDAGRFLGAAAAWGHGKLGGNEALAAAGREGMADTGRDLGASVASAVVPGLTAPIARGAIKGADAAKGSRRPTQAQREVALERSRGPDGVERCTHCDTPLDRRAGSSNSAEIDHRQAWSRGGKTEDSNLDAACRGCNRSKGSKELGTEWVPPKDRK